MHSARLTRQLGTSSALRFILASPLPTQGSFGGPIVDAASGSVVGMISGRRMDNRIEGERGWGVTTERIFDVSSVMVSDKQADEADVRYARICARP